MCFSGEQGLFRLGPLVPATFSLVAGRSSSRFAKSDSAEAWSGQTDVILRLKRAASISGMVIDALTGDPAPEHREGRQLRAHCGRARPASSDREERSWPDRVSEGHRRPVR
jgi:hypothetical protein